MSHAKIAVILACCLGTATSGCALVPEPTSGQHEGTTAMLVGLSPLETADQRANTIGCAKATIAWAAEQGAKLVMAPVGLPGQERWSTVDFALRTSAQRTNPDAAKKLRREQEHVAEDDLRRMLATPLNRSSMNVLAAATDGSRVLNYAGGPRTLVLCTAAEQVSPELTLGPSAISHHAIEVELFRLRQELEPMRLTRIVFGAAGDSEKPDQSLAEQAGHEEFWRTWAHHEGAIHFSYGPTPHFPYPSQS
jgi:hypothetical protein